MKKTQGVLCWRAFAVIHGQNFATACSNFVPCSRQIIWETLSTLGKAFKSGQNRHFQRCTLKWETCHEHLYVTWAVDKETLIFCGDSSWCFLILVLPESSCLSGLKSLETHGDSAPPRFDTPFSVRLIWTNIYRACSFLNSQWLLPTRLSIDAQLL